MQSNPAEKRLKLTTRDYARLATWRHVLREFLHFSESAAAKAGLSAQHYQAMLILRACPEEQNVTINDLARDLFIKHNSAVGLADRLVKEGLAVREPSRADRRKVHLQLTARGRQVLAKLAGIHRRELQRIGPSLEKLLAELARDPVAP